jgi:preprotein translocase subunit SecF
MLVVLATWVLGSGPIKDFAFALFVGIIVGTYSSLYVASPVFLWVNERFYRGKGHLLMAEKTEREGTGTLLGSPSPEEVGEDGRSEADRRGAAEDAIDAEAEEAAPGEKKTRRRRRRRPGAGS